MKINLPIAGVKPVSSIEVLNLRIGQQIAGKIISVTNDEVLLQMAGYSLRARLDGVTVNPGSHYRFQVLESNNGDLKLKLLAALDGAPEANQSIVAVDERVSPNQNLINLLNKYGLDQNSVPKLVEELQKFETKHQYPLKPEIMAFMLAQQWAVTPGTTMFAWIANDPELRNTIWKLLKQLLPADQADRVLLNSESEAEVIKEYLIKNHGHLHSQTKTDASASTEPINHRVENNAEPDLPEQLQKLLEASCQLRPKTQTETNLSVDSAVVRFPVLDFQQQIHEASIEWQSNGNPNEPDHCQQLVKLKVPTANLGLIEVAIGVNMDLLKVNFTVEKELVKNLLLSNNAELKRLLEEQSLSTTALINVKLKPDQTINVGTGELDLWM
ncbi:MAG TPA: hypothetical protein PL158_12035 [Bacillota bacterium]|jgi:hypothetical protein|nr:hypothetical protein [Bacillota bacterium]HOL10862.1 hypothetical protein [Bacillota bacterium]